MFQRSLTAKCGIEYFPFIQASLSPQCCRKFCYASDILRNLVKCDLGVNLHAILGVLGAFFAAGGLCAYPPLRKKSGSLTPDGATLSLLRRFLMLQGHPLCMAALEALP